MTCGCVNVQMCICADGQMMGEASVREPLSLLMAYHDHRVVGMPSHPAVEWQRGLLLSWKVVHVGSTT